MTNQKIKFGIVGLGHIGTRHAQCVIDNPNAVLSCVYDILPKKRWQITNESIMFCSSFDALIEQNVDVINICTPNYLHAKMAISILKAGKHVVIEKPIALSTKDAQAILETSNKCKKIVFGVMQNRFSPTVLWLKKVIK